MTKRHALLLYTLLFISAAAQAHDLPLGDGKISASGPKPGYIYSCQSRFMGRGAFGPTPWIENDLWDPAGKPTVDGTVQWPNAAITVTLEGTQRVIRANNLPSHATGEFPIARSDDAYQYDRNPNSIRTQSIVLSLPALPQIAKTASCLSMGMVGFALDGTAIFNGLDAQGRDAPAHEVQDSCNGHPQRSGQYHYHNASPCMKDTRSETSGHSDLVGYALDGFGIYGLYGEGGKKITNADLDACHGHTHEIMWDGQKRTLYHYHLSEEYPYTLGCFTGTPLHVAHSGEDERPRGAPQGGPGHRRPPPFERP